MKTDYSKDFCRNLKYAISVVFLFFGVVVQAQVTEEEEESRDTIKGYNTGKVEIPNPTSIVEAYTYDPVTNKYIFTKKFDGFNINYPIILTPEQYQELVLRESMRAYFQEKSNAMDGKGTEEQQKNLLPRYYVNSGFFETIFGGNTIDIKPQGSVELDLGVRYTKQDNPAISPRNRKTLTFDFDQRISMSLQGKVGTRLNVTANYDTESTFAFQNLIKLEYTPTEDDIIQKIEVGNVSFPLSNSLVRGAQSLFGVKMALQFGKTTVTGIFSEQKSQTKTVTAQGGGTIQDFQMFALDYDSDKHFFLSQYFRNNYDYALRQYPQIYSRVQITRIEVWVTNRQNRINATENNSRNIIALQDLGESRLIKPNTNTEVTAETVGVFANTTDAFFNAVDGTKFDLFPDNQNNKLDPEKIGTAEGWLRSSIREIVTVDGNSFDPQLGPISEGRDYSKLENARKLTTSEYKYHPQLGYISLNQKLNNDEVLAVAYQYTVGDKVYQVGEFGTDGVAATDVTPGATPEASPVPSTKSLMLKMLKSNLVNTSEPVWDLMMKNIYMIPGAFQLAQEDFRMNILYTDPSPLNYITPVDENSPLPEQGNSSTEDTAVANTPLLRVFNVDRLNYTNDPQVDGDGFFDFVPGLTVDTDNGRIIFTTVEPFGEHLYYKLDPTAPDYNITPETSYVNNNQKKYVFRKLYKSTQADALQDSQKNKFQLRGRFKSTGGDGIPIGAFNVPQGSVVVTAGGRVLVEGVDYTVNYQLGRVQILDASLQASNTPIEVSVENNSVFGQQTRRFAGFNIEHKFNDKFLIGGTLLNMSERPFTNKTNYGQESVNNTIFGFNVNYATEVPFFTRLVNKLPNVDTDVPSNFSFRGEVAYLKPGASKADQFNGEATTYVEDFEGSQTNIDMRSALGWSLSSAPATLFAGGVSPANDLSYGYKRAKLAWYSIDPVFYAQGAGGADVPPEDIASNRTRRIYYEELYPVTDVAPGQSLVVNTLDLSYYPQERGPYNFNPTLPANNFRFTETEATDNWAGIMRSINSTNFEQTNVEYIQFWVMDPYSWKGGEGTDATNTGMLEINLGELSEDILKDNRKQYENGLPEAGGNQPVFSTVWGDVPVSQSLIYAFDTNTANRDIQDVGFDGLTDDEEAVKYPEFAGLEDPSGDNYRFYLAASGNVLEKYKDYNGTQGNSPVDIGSNNRGSTTLPDTEDINRDNTMNTIDSYYRYQIPIAPGQMPGEGYLVDARDFDRPVPGGGPNAVGRWLLYKVPVDAGESVGGIESVRSIRFMRLLMSGFKEDVTLRFAALDLVRGEWRRYTSSLDANDPNLDDPVGTGDGATGFDVVALNVQENGSREPIKYVSPPGVRREQLYTNNAVINQNEQSLSLRVYSVPTGTSAGGLEPNDSRAVFKNVNVDMRQYKKLRMFLHAEALAADAGTSRALQPDQMKAFMRFGNDFTDNFYEVQMKLKVTAQGASLAEDIWPSENEILVTLDALTKLKVRKLNGDVPTADVNGVVYVPAQELDASLSPDMIIGIRGNPNFGNIRTLMLGLRNDNAENIRGEVWFNELRLSDMDNKGGMAAVASMDTNFADFATVSATGRMSTIGFGTIEQSPNERSREDTKQYDVVTNVNLGKMLPKKWAINLPFNYAVGEEIITPEYDPFQQDVKLEQMIDNTNDQAEKDNLRERAIDYTKRKSINFIGVKKDRAPEQKQHIYDPENLTFNYSFNQTDHHDYEIENLLDQQLKTGVDYNFTFKPKPIEPLKNNAYMKKSQYWKILQDFNFNYLPNNITFSTNIMRQFNRQEFRNVDVDGIPISPLYRRNYFFEYRYGFNYNITRSLKLNYTVATSNIVRNYLDQRGVPLEGYNIWSDFWDMGETNQHDQSYLLNYDLPINKVPALSFVKATYSYGGSYGWLRSNDALATAYVGDAVYDLGNTIQNKNMQKLNTTLNLDQLYKYVGLTGKKTPAKGAAPKVAPKPGEKITAAPKPATDGNPFVNGLIGILTSVKNVQINYTETNGTVLPGYLPGIGFFGTSKPTLDFIFGSQDDDVRMIAARNGYLTVYPEYNQNFTQVNTKELDLTARVDLFPDFTIDLTANRDYANNYSEQYDVSDINNDGVLDYNSLSPYTFGNFQMSTILIGTAFSKSDVNGSDAFDQMRANRLVIANRLATQHYGTTNFPVYTANGDDSDFSKANAGYPVGFGRNSQAVLLPAFMAAYSGQDANKVSTGFLRDIPLPNWLVKYTGLMRYKFFKDKFKRFSLQHSYKATYTVNAYRSNFDYGVDEATGDIARDNNGEGNFYNRNIISNINLTEQFNPLIRVDFEMKNSIKVLAEIRKDRSLNMSFDNNLLTEVKGNEYIIGLGYRIKDVIINSSLADNPTNTIKSDINIKTDFSLRKNETIVRYLDYDNNQLGGGQNIWSVKLTADYAFSKNLTAIFYYDHSFSKAVISTSYPLTNIRTGFTLRYNFGN